MRINIIKKDQELARIEEEIHEQKLKNNEYDALLQKMGNRINLFSSFSAFVFPGAKTGVLSGRELSSHGKPAGRR